MNFPFCFRELLGDREPGRGSAQILDHPVIGGIDRPDQGPGTGGHFDRRAGGNIDAPCKGLCGAGADDTLHPVVKARSGMACV